MLKKMRAEKSKKGAGPFACTSRRGSAGKRRRQSRLAHRPTLLPGSCASGPVEPFHQPIFARPDLSHTEATHFSHAAQCQTRTALNFSSRQSVAHRPLENTTKMHMFEQHAKDSPLRPHLTSSPPKAILGLSCERRSQGCAACRSPMTTSCMPHRLTHGPVKVGVQSLRGQESRAPPTIKYHVFCNSGSSIHTPALVPR